MAKRIRLGLTYVYDENWIGGTYYIENLVKSLNTLEDTEKPEIVAIVVKKSDFLLLEKSTSYPYLKFQIHSGEKNLLFRLFNVVTRRLFEKSLFSLKIANLDGVFPYSNSVQFDLAKKKIYWIPDFQDHFLPKMFSAAELENRLKLQKKIVYSNLDLVISSRDAFNHLKQIFPDYTVSPHVVPFAVSLPHLRDNTKIIEVNQRKIPDNYFICCNQFWAHKNHLIILKAIKHLKDNGQEVNVIFTGNVSGSFESQVYYKTLTDFIETHNLSTNAILLGFVDREIQLNLLLNATAVIQPSLFEGWSTIVEDAKFLNKSLIISDLKIHREQLEKYEVQYFDPSNEIDLATHLNLTIDKGNESKNISSNYRENSISFAKKFMAILQE
ncbi:glycosyltransferase [Pedobacter arcticus]|uniref:glycosyltransferase n=1 Tax=Pedobacter arcticus TaxID=752140 RepID=UPI00031EA402|nr:glycosyltransferase [Pedobacter arcticus]